MLYKGRNAESTDRAVYDLHEGTKDLFAEDLNADVNAAYAMIEIYRTLFPEEQNTNENNVRKAE